MKAVVYGGQYGSEGKGSLSEYLATSYRKIGSKPDTSLAVFGENSPNSGHTCSAGKTRNLPAASYYADVVILGPDSVINLDILAEDMAAIKEFRGKLPQIYIHECAALMNGNDVIVEQHALFQIESRIASTTSGSGACRSRKHLWRATDAIVRDLTIDGCIIVNSVQYFNLIKQIQFEDRYDMIFECSQGTLLDINFGIYPYVTSRCTLPRVAVERNGLGGLNWTYYGVYRTYPIRTGGNSGPTGADETSFSNIGQEQEIATVTKRIRRIFEFSVNDFRKSLFLTRPDVVAFTHLDYLGMDSHNEFYDWLLEQCSGEVVVHPANLIISSKLGHFTH